MGNGRAIGGLGDPKSHYRSVDAVVAGIAAGQRGRVARRQILAAGVSPTEIRHRLKTGFLIQEHPGVYAVGHRSQTWEGRLMAAWLSAGDDAAISHLTAGAHRRLIRFRPSAIDVTCPRALRDRPPLRFHRSILPADEVEVIDGIPTTTVARTLLDLASVLTPAKLALAINEAEVQELTSPSSLPSLLERHPRRPGAAAIREILASNRLGKDRGDSELEDRFSILMIEEELPPPISHAAIELPSGTVVVDRLWLPQRVVLELDGDKFHRAPYRRRLDRARDRALTIAGYRPLRAGWHEVEVEPGPFVDGLRRLLELTSRQ